MGQMLHRGLKLLQVLLPVYFYTLISRGGSKESIRSNFSWKQILQNTLLPFNWHLTYAFQFPRFHRTNLRYMEKKELKIKDQTTHYPLIKKQQREIRWQYDNQVQEQFNPILRKTCRELMTNLIFNDTQSRWNPGPAKRGTIPALSRHTEMVLGKPKPSYSWKQQMTPRPTRVEVQHKEWKNTRKAFVQC